MVISSFDHYGVWNFEVAASRFSETQWTPALGQKQNLEISAETDI
jgi:hypothetical protein